MTLVYSQPTSLEVSFPSYDGLQLEGTLRLPDTSAGSVPGVVLIHGSGTLSRNSTLTGQLAMSFGFGIPVFYDIAVALQAQGIAVLTYDKRICGAFNNCNNNSYPAPDIASLTMDDYIRDAQAAVRFLNDHADIDAIVVIGHNQAGTFVPILLEAYPMRITSGVLLASPFRSIDQVLVDQRDFLVNLSLASGLNETEVMNSPAVVTLTDLVLAVTAIAEDRFTEDVEPISGNTVAFWKSWIALADRAQNAAINMQQPVLLLGGDMDWNVPISELDLWAAHLRKNNKRFLELIMPCVTNVLNCGKRTGRQVRRAAPFSMFLHSCVTVSESDPTMITVEDLGRTVDARVTAALAEFVKKSIAATRAPIQTLPPLLPTPAVSPTAANPSSARRQDAWRLGWVVVWSAVLLYAI